MRFIPKIKKLYNLLIGKIVHLYFIPVIFIAIIFIVEGLEKITNNTNLSYMIGSFAIMFYTIFIFTAFEYIAYVSAKKDNSVSAILKICGSIIVTIVFFAILYQYIYKIDSTSFKGDVGNTLVSQFISFVYFSVITFATIGYGDICPSSIVARIVVIMEVIYQFIVIILVISQFTILKKQFEKKSPFAVNNEKNDAQV
jgi:voltage-gated potassium channel